MEEWRGLSSEKMGSRAGPFILKSSRSLPVAGPGKPASGGGEGAMVAAWRRRACGQICTWVWDWSGDV